MVGRCPTIQLMSREPIRHHQGFQKKNMRPSLLRGVRHRFQCLSPCDGQVAHALRTLPPVAGRVLLLPAAPRLACVKPAASVHPEPGSNSSLYIPIFLSLTLTVSLSQESTLSIIVSRYLLLVLFVQSFQRSLPYSPPSEGLFPVPFRPPEPPCGCPRSERDCKGSHFFFTSKLFPIFFSIFFRPPSTLYHFKSLPLWPLEHEKKF